MSFQQVTAHLAVWDVNHKVGCITLQTTKLSVLAALSAEDFQSLKAVLNGSGPIFFDDISRRLQGGNLNPSVCTGAGMPCACTGAGPDCTGLGLPSQPTHCSGAGPDCTTSGHPGCTGAGFPDNPDCTNSGPNCRAVGQPEHHCTVSGKPDLCTGVAKPLLP